jgi:hypothetical protein
MDFDTERYYCNNSFCHDNNFKENQIRYDSVDSFAIHVPDFKNKVFQKITEIINFTECSVKQKEIIQSEAERILSGHILRAEENEITIPKHANPSTYAVAIIYAIFQFYDEFPKLSLRKMSEMIKVSRSVISKCYKRWFSNYFKPRPEPEPEPLSKELEELKEKVKKINWDNVSQDWVIKKAINNYRTDIIELNPYEDCDKDSNPLYMCTIWLKRLYHGLDLTDKDISKICGINKRWIGYWRERLGIATKENLEYYIGTHGYKSVLMPQDYQHPQMSSIPSGRQYMRLHRVVMETFLREHPNLEKSKKYLINGKYLSIDVIIHHINHDKLNNRIENLWLYSDDAEHHLLAKSSLNSCLSALIKIGQIIFKNGVYSYDNSFDYRNKYGKREIQEIIKPVEFKVPFEDIDEIRDEIKKWDWDKVSQNWIVDVHQQDHSHVQVKLDPYKDCDRDLNPLYMHIDWLKKILGDYRFNLKDSRLCKLCDITKAMAQYWRDKVHKIHTKYTRAGLYKRLDSDGYILIKVPRNYKNPFAEELKIPYNVMLEHRYVVERALASSSNLELKKKLLIDGKYLKRRYLVHHINLDILDNRLENLWVTDNHEKIHGELFSLTKKLMEDWFLGFRKGKYFLKKLNFF